MKFHFEGICLVGLETVFFDIIDVDVCQLYPEKAENFEASLVFYLPQHALLCCHLVLFPIGWIVP